MKTIFDLGMHHGLDTGFYLAKGFSVIALEANPEFCDRAATKFAEEVVNGRLKIVNKALASASNEMISFFLNPIKDDWSSTSRQWAEKGGHEVQEITVSTITLSDMIAEHGVPYYIKCDLEGTDLLFCEQLKSVPQIPEFASVEAMDVKMISILADVGYRRFQIINQALNGFIQPPSPPREGSFTEVTFNGHMSGLFGNELDPAGWISVDECRARFRMFWELKRLDINLAHGWLDFHAAR